MLIHALNVKIACKWQIYYYIYITIYLIYFIVNVTKDSLIYIWKVFNLLGGIYLYCDVTQEDPRGIQKTNDMWPWRIVKEVQLRQCVGLDKKTQNQLCFRDVQLNVWANEANSPHLLAIQIQLLGLRLFVLL